MSADLSAGVGPLARADVVVALKGGLGNQLFQWAFGNELAARGARVRYDTGLLAPGVPFELTTLIESDRLVQLPVRALRALRKANLPATLSPWRHVTEPGFTYTDPAALGLRGRVLLEGYWQSPRYFARTEVHVRRAIEGWARAALTDEGRALRAATGAGVWSVHVRRGDYLTGAAAGVHGVLDADYYRRALDRARAAGARRFHVFTNDHAWVAAELAAADVVAVPWSVATAPIGEIGLMAVCEGHVVANSSFSWWGAWLGQHPERTFAPDRWFADPTLDPRDLVPRRWTRLPATAP